MKKCIFCSRPVDSAEHLWSEWILEEFKSHVELKNPIRFTKGKSRERWIHNPEVRITCVCHKCNNEWMSDIETQNKPIMLPMTRGQRSILQPRHQKSLARWAMLKAMVLEAADRQREPFYSEEERCDFKPPSSSIPVQSHVWVGRFSSIGFHMGGTGIVRPLENIPKAINGHITTIVLGYLAIQVLTARILPMFANRCAIPLDQQPGKWHVSLSKIWPVFDFVEWPPAVCFTRKGPDSIGSLVNRWKVGIDMTE